MIYKDAVSKPCAIATWNDVIHSKQVWVSEYKLPWDDGIMLLHVYTLTVNIDIVPTSCGIALKIMGSATRYVLEGINGIVVDQRTPIYEWTRFEFQGVKCNRMIEWCCKLTVCIDTVSNPCDIALKKWFDLQPGMCFRVWFTFGLSADVNFVYEYTLQYFMQYLIYNGISSKLYAIARRNDGIHSKQVWVTWYRLKQDDGMTPICI